MANRRLIEFELPPVGCASQEGTASCTGAQGCLHGWSFRGLQKGETELREGLGEIDGRSEPFPLKLHSLLLEGMFMVGILSLKGDRTR